MPNTNNCFKIGCTNNLKQRIKDLSRTTVPMPFILIDFIACYCINKNKKKNNSKNILEKKLHVLFKESRINNTEYFDVTKEEITHQFDTIRKSEDLPKCEIIDKDNIIVKINGIIVDFKINDKSNINIITNGNALVDKIENIYSMRSKIFNKYKKDILHAINTGGILLQDGTTYWSDSNNLENDRLNIDSLDSVNKYLSELKRIDTKLTNGNGNLHAMLNIFFNFMI